MWPRMGRCGFEIVRVANDFVRLHLFSSFSSTHIFINTQIQYQMRTNCFALLCSCMLLQIRAVFVHHNVLLFTVTQLCFLK